MIGIWSLALEEWFINTGTETIPIQMSASLKAETPTGKSVLPITAHLNTNTVRNEVNRGKFIILLFPSLSYKLVCLWHISS